ncbi:stress-response A/B barrel domain-containing protein At5g22580-like [Solanum verrucosum]|nr:stress-response A/B barrel domain-containing protein At5g22580-like [Solanum verrucosum]
MANEFKNMLLVKFKQDVVEEDVLKQIEQLVNEIDLIKSFVWGKDTESNEMVTQGYTHAMIMTFNNKEDYEACVVKEVEFSAVFVNVVEKILVLNFPAVCVKASS